MTWKKETLRDLEALGSYVFLIVVASRSLIGRHWGFLGRIALALAISMLLWHALKYFTGIKSSSHASNAAIILVFISAFYQVMEFTVFAIALLGIVLYAHAKLRKHKTYLMVTGAIIGVVASGASWWLTTRFI